MRRRTLNRPRIVWIPAIALIALVETIAELLASYMARNSAVGFSSCYALAQVAVTLLFGRWVLISFIRIYQRYAPDHIRLRCHCQPSCSEYSIAVLRRYGFVAGGIKALRRVFHTCNGQDVTDLPYKNYKLSQTL